MAKIEMKVHIRQRAWFRFAVSHRIWLLMLYPIIRFIPASWMFRVDI